MELIIIKRMHGELFWRLDDDDDESTGPDGASLVGK